MIDKLPELETLGKVDKLPLEKVLEVGGLYLFSAEDERVFLGQTDNLHHRIDRHMEVSASHGLPNWLWDTKRKPLQISISGLPQINRSIRQKMEILLVKMWHPLLNLSRVA